MPGLSSCRQFQPQCRLLANISAPEMDLPVPAGIDMESLIEQKFSILDQILVVLHKRLGPKIAADLLVRRAQEDDVAVEPSTRSLDQEQRFELGDCHSLHIEGTAPPQLAVMDLTLE